MTTIDPIPSTTAPTAPPSGWYVDPQDPAHERWWTGASWSDTRRARPVASVTPAGFAPQRRSRAAYWSLALGIVSTLLALSELIGPAHGTWLSSFGVIAIVSGVRALRMRRAGVAVPAAAAVVGIALGALATLLMLAVLLLTALLPADVSAGGGTTLRGATGDADGRSSEPLQPFPASALPDDALASYHALPVRSVTASKAGCPGVTADPEPVAPDGAQRTAARTMQDSLSMQIQTITAGIRRTSTPANPWPKAIDVDPQTETVFLPAPACTALGALPAVTEVRYATSRDGAQVALGVFNTADQVGQLWRSVDDTIYRL